MKNRGFLYIRKDAFHIDRLFDELIHHPWHNREFKPFFDLIETADSYIFEADCPGMTIEDIHLSLKGDILEVSGERKIKITLHHGNLHFRERSYGKFLRAIQLPSDSDKDSIRTEMDHGVLRIFIKKMIH